MIMRRIAALTLALAALAPPAAANEPGGTLCGMAATQDPQVTHAYTGVVFGGPVTFVAPTPLVLYCTVQVNASTHAGFDACVAPGGLAGVGAAAGFCTYGQMELDNVYVCTRS